MSECKNVDGKWMSEVDIYIESMLSMDISTFQMQITQGRHFDIFNAYIVYD